jgi:P4 family phage/plasmid primase-like protien
MYYAYYINTICIFITNMEKAVHKFNQKGYIVFSVEIGQEEKNGKWKKKPFMPKGWQQSTDKTAHIDFNKNGLALLTGKVNNIIVIDIDNVDQWEKLLEEENKEEPNTVKVKSGSGGIHYYFKYDEDLANVTSKDHAIKDYAIDVKTNGGCIYVPPTKYFNKNVNKEVKYKWENSLFDMEPAIMPKWLKELLLEKHKEKKVKNKETKNDDIKIEEIDDKQKENKADEIDNDIEFDDDEIEEIIEALSKKRADEYASWINVGMCLYNINKDYIYIWKKFSKKCNEKYDKNACEEKWKSFKKNKNGLKIGSLLLWCKEDNEAKYKEIIEKKRLNNMIIAKYPNDKLILGEVREISDVCKYIDIVNESCIFKGCKHEDLFPSMYIEVTSGYMTAKCKHPECYGKIHCGHKLLTKQETNFIFNGNVFNININNSKDDDLVEFQKINLFEDEDLNELVYNGLNGKSSQLAEIIYFYYYKKYNYGENNEWYVYEKHKWKNIGGKNLDLRGEIQKKLKDVYTQLLNHYKENKMETKKINVLKQLINSFGDTILKNNIMVELVDLFLGKKNKDRDFVKKLDNNNNLIGFENGIYDLEKFEFREGNPDDLITMTTGYNYNKEYTNKYKDLLKFLEDIQPNEKEREYMLTYLSIGLFGNMLELFTILSGNGRNGKSKIIELLGETLGEYFGSVQSQMFTRPRPDANSPDPGLLSLAKKRIVIASEPEKNSKLNSGFIKFLTGRDSTTLRNCHSNEMVKFMPKFLSLLICNDIPECDDMDNAFSKRLRCINFPTEFVDNPKTENQKKIDTNVNKNFEYWKNDFMLLLIEYFKKYTKTQQLIPTENILTWTNKYKEDTDMYLQFLNECTEDSETHLQTTVLYEAFKIWYISNNPKTKIPSNREFMANLKRNKKTAEHVKIEGATKYGIKNLKLKNDG